MDWGFTLLFVALLIGIAAGMLIERKLYSNRKNTDVKGILNVDCSDPANGTSLYLELAVPIAEVVEQKQVVFNVHTIR